MIKLIRRVISLWWREVKAPFQPDPPRPPMDWGDSSEPVEPSAQPWSNPEHDVMKDVRDYIKSDAFRKPPPVVTDRDLMTAEERALWGDIEGGKPKHEPIVYPPVREQSTQDWVTERLQQLTGGLTRHPMDVTNYPTPPTEADKAAREHFNRPTPVPIARGYFSHGYSMSYLRELLSRADRKDMTLSAEDLMSLRSRGLA